MQSIFLTSLIFITGVVMPATVNANEPPLKIRSVFNIKSALCNIKTNGVTGMDNRDSAFSGSGGGISSTNSLLFLENGTNEISVEIGSLDWFSEGGNNKDNKGNFSLNSACKLDLVRFNGSKQNLITSIDVRINKHGIPEAWPQDSNLVGKKILAEQIEPGHFDKEYFDELFFPKGMELYEFKKEVIISGVPEWEWINATPYTNTKEQLQELRNAYSEMAGIINSRNRELLKKFDHVALKAWSVTTGETEDDILESQYPKERLEAGKIKIEPMVWEDYEVRVMNKGRIVQLYNKSEPTFSPLTYYYVDSDGEKMKSYFAPMFSMIDGKFVPVI